VAANAADDFKRELAARYTQATGKTPEIYVCQAADGARIL
jgi:galactokinase